MYYNNDLYREDLTFVLNSGLPLEQLKDSSILITGASGMIGSFLVDLLMLYNELVESNIDVYALGRDGESLKKRFKTHVHDSQFHIIEQDVTQFISGDYKFDYIIHAASNAYPHVFSTDPVGTIMGNILGVYNLLEYSRQKGLKRFLFVSSGEVYGQGTEGLDSFNEEYNGYVEITNPRSCYPNAKRASETLCVSYTHQHKVETVIVRPSHTYGPTATSHDNRVSAQFINDALAQRSIVMKSEGLQHRSYCYVADCASGILTVLLKGVSGNAYNIANKKSNVTIKELALTISTISGQELLFELPSQIEKAGYTPILKALLDATKLENLGWKAKYSLEEGLMRTIEILT